MWASRSSGRKVDDLGRDEGARVEVRMGSR